ncbi:expressed unknown protein [Seminavis robusta]|uniref:PDZ domain-containing protein n=1 Tax=Seminavis robusta TaxID=568900 RepID=A0A9N8F2Y7_9STRA|nr:expressed unknown protein [Seminavis robusta]|eukprot:Sro2946_g340770.1 n/a (421) ;mRNA; f:5599-7053
MSFFGNLFQGDDDKKKSGGGGNKSGGGPKNPFANMGQKKFQGSGKSLGGTGPGKIIHIELKDSGTLGLRIEKRANGQGTSIVSMVVPGSQADVAGLMRGDILCFAGSEGKSEIMYDDFLAMATSGQRPVVFDVRRITTKAGNNTAAKTADSFARKQAVIAAAEAREKAHKSKTKPVPKGEKKLPVILSAAEKRQQDLERERDAQLKTQETPKTEEARKAMELAKRNETEWANQLGYNPYETNKATAGQARNATVTAQHGAVGGGASGSGGGSAEPQSIPAVRPPAEAAAPAKASDRQVAEDAILIHDHPEFEEPYTMVLTTNTHDVVLKSFTIIRTLVKNATTKGQAGDEAGAKFRRVRLTNAKIKAAIVDINGGLELMMAFGFQLVEENGESCLVFPFGSNGPAFVEAALRQMERYEKS